MGEFLSKLALKYDTINERCDMPSIRWVNKHCVTKEEFLVIVKIKKTILSLTAALLVLGSTADMRVIAAKPISLLVDGKDITHLSSPIIENDRTLVPIRFISEELGATVTWNESERSVFVQKGNDTVLLRIGSNLVQYDNGADYDVSDVAPKIYNDRTFVPLRLVSNALGIAVDWNDSARTVLVDSNKKGETTNFFDIKILSQNPGQTISGKANLQLGTSELYTIPGNEVRFLLLEPSTGKGFMVARGSLVNGSHTFLPRIEDNGNKILVGAVYDKNGKFLGGDSIPVNINVNPSLSIRGLNSGQVITGDTTFGVDLNFFPAYIKYEIKNLSTGKTTLTGEEDPLGTFTWSPVMSDNGNYEIRAIAYDTKNNPYPGNPVGVQVSLTRFLGLGGVTPGQTINNSVNLIAKRNFDVSETQYLSRDVNTGIISTIAKIPYGGYKYFPGPNDTGTKELIVRVLAGGVTYDSDPIRVYIEGSPKLLLEGIGPKQVVTGPTTLKVNSNVNLDSVSYFLTNIKTGARKAIASNVPPTQAVTYTPASSDAGEVTIQAEGSYQGKKVLSEKINFRVYLGEVHGPQPIIQKDKFLGLASGLARTSYEKTGMSAALQTAQAILETGWGQSVPVDKYTGLLSNNLFGIKGVGPKGSVTSNTWEVYNGITYRVDADFRAYDNVNQSWADHKEFLNRDRYTNFRGVMYDYMQGAWALRRAGYATDPQYPIKLMKLIDTYNLDELDKVGI